MRPRLARQRLGEEPRLERSRRRFIEGAHGKMVENHPPMSPTRAPGKIVAFYRIGGHADPRRQVLDHRGREVGLEFVRIDPWAARLLEEEMEEEEGV